MASLSVPYSFTNGTTANAAEVNSNFAAVKNFVESQAVQVDGSVKATLASLATEIVNRLVPVGTIVAYGGASAPAGWLLCDGTAIPGGNPNLVAIVGGNTPNLKGRTLVGRDAAAAPFNGALLSTLGSATSVASHSHGAVSSHTHTVDVLVGGGHTHDFTTSSNNHNHTNAVESVTSGTHGHGTSGTAGSTTGNNTEGSDGTGFTSHDHTGTTDEFANHDHGVTVSSDGGHSHPAFGDTYGNVQPSTLVNYIIKHD